MSYVQVWSRLLSTTIPIVDLGYEEHEGPKPGKDYTTTTGEWTLHANHDSCWREGLTDLLRLYDREILCFAGIGAWFKMKEAASMGLPDPEKARDRSWSKS